MSKVYMDDRIVNGRLKQTGIRFHYMRYNWSAVFECDCGNRIIADCGHVRSGYTTSCGCFHRERTMLTASTHGHTRSGQTSAEYRAWSKLKSRCTNKSDKQYDDYGGRGITVCDRWLESFENFISDMGAKPAGFAIDRIRNNEGYSPDNCRWTTNSRNNRNKRNNRLLEFSGEVMCCADWADRVGISKGLLHSRLKQGWSVEKALTTPVRKMKDRS